MIAQSPSVVFPPGSPPIDGWVVPNDHQGEMRSSYLRDAQPTSFGLNHEFKIWAMTLPRGYAIDGGANSGGKQTSNIKITNNRFSRLYFPQCGYYGPFTAFDSSGPGNAWSGMI
jgi:hypothetical protein